MFPVLFKIGSFPIHTYGFLIAIGFLTAIQVVKHLSAKAGLDVEKILDLSFWCLAVGFVGARVLFVITRWDVFSHDPAAIFKIWEGGLVFFGGPIAALPFAVYYMRKHKIPLWRSMDAMVPGLVVNHAFGRLGCLAAGCCYGKPTGANWGLKFDSELVDRSLHGIFLHPTQLYEATALFILFFSLLKVFKTKAFDGQVVFVYFMAYPIIRSIIEAFRGDLIRGFVIDDVLSTSQFISILVFAIATFFLVKRLKEVNATPQVSNERKNK